MIRAYFSKPELYINESYFSLGTYINKRTTEDGIYNLEAYCASLAYIAYQQKKDIGAATYSFSSPLIAAALKAYMSDPENTGILSFHYDGSTIEESDRAAESYVDEIIASARSDMDHISIRDSSSDGIMHNKFMVVGSTVLLGSFNFGIKASLVQDNNIVIIQSPTLANSLRNKLDRLSRGQEGRLATDSSDILHVKLADDTIISLLYGPSQDICGYILSILHRNDIRSIKIAMFTFTRDDIAEAIIDANASTAQVIMDGPQTNNIIKQNNIKTMLQEGSIQVKIMDRGVNGTVNVQSLTGELLAMPYAMHHKFYLVELNNGTQVVITGSQNATKSANTINDEIMVVIEHNADIYNAYNQRFNQMWNE